MTMVLWEYNAITGLWRYGRSVTPETAEAWLALWQQSRPAGHVVLARRRPRRMPSLGK